MLVEIIAILLFILAVGMLAFFFVMKNRMSGKVIPPNANIVINMNPSLTGGYSFLLEIEVRELSNGRYHCKVVPIGRYYDLLKDEYAEPIEIYEIIVEHNFRIESTRGIPHKARASVVYLPKNPQKLDRLFADSELGVLSKQASNYNGLKNMFLAYVEEIKRQVGEILILTPKLPEKVILSRLDDMFSKVRDTIDKDKGGSSGFQPGPKF